MSDTYEVVVDSAGRRMFQDCFLRYMDRVGFRHLGVGGRLGALSVHDFQSDLGIVSMSALTEGQSRFRMVVSSEAVAVQPLVLDALTEGIADFLEPFCDGLSSTEDGRAIRDLIKGLRDSFPEDVRSSRRKPDR